MLGDYTTLIGYAAGAINGIIAVRVAQFPLESARSKHLLVAIVSVVAAGSMGLGVYAQHEVIVQKNAQIKHDRDIQINLAAFITQGDQLQSEITDTSQPYSVSQSLSWAKSVVGFLDAQLNPSYDARFMDDTGILHGEPVGIDDQRQGYWNWVYNRTERLEEFSREIPSP